MFLEQPVPGDEQRNGGGPHQVLLPAAHPTRGAGHQGDQHHNIQVSLYYGISLATTVSYPAEFKSRLVGVDQSKNPVWLNKNIQIVSLLFK
jgi:hypothetical protein